MKGYLVLENGRVFSGKLLNDCLASGGEVVFTTAMISYQDIITDPSYYGQIIVMTYPLVGNVGFNEKSFASRASMIKGLVLREATDFPSHYEMETDLISFLNNSEIAVLTEVDTRALTRELRTNGPTGGIITAELTDLEMLKQKARAAAAELNGDLIRFVSRKNIMQFGSSTKKIVLLDLGTKRGVINSFNMRDVSVIAVPTDTTAEEITHFQPQGVFISDGPGDPRTVPYVIDTIKKLYGKYPLLGVGMGHQLIALACGAHIEKLRQGHRGSNHPVKDVNSHRVYITTQNHGYAVSIDSLKNTDLVPTFTSLHDGVLEGVKHKTLPISSVQFDPEGYTGYSDTGFVFDDFIAALV